MLRADGRAGPADGCLWGWTYVARGEALLALPIEAPGPAAPSPACGAEEGAFGRTRIVAAPAALTGLSQRAGTAAP